MNAKRTQLQRDVEKACLSSGLPECIPPFLVSRRTGIVGCFVEVRIANHIFSKRITRRRLIGSQLGALCDMIRSDDGAIAVGKTVIKPDATYGWSCLSRLRTAGRQLLDN